MQDILTVRVKTALVLMGTFLLVGFIDSIVLTWLVLGVVMLFALHESSKLLNVEDDSIYTYAVITWFIAYIYPKPEDLIFIIAIIFGSILAYSQTFKKDILLPMLYPLASFLFIYSLYLSYGMESLLWLVMVVAGTDVGAYYVGKKLGSTQFCETSPNKTLEGVIGGIIVAVFIGIIFAIDGVGFWTAFIVSFIVSIASIFGDLFESYLKREADVKDSGEILPGHGGILDRVDGYLFGGVAMLIFLRLLA